VDRRFVGFRRIAVTWLDGFRIAPPLVAVLAFFSKHEFFGTAPAKSQPYKLLGCLFPALWLTSVGPAGLVTNGGFLMRFFESFGIRFENQPQAVATTGLVWLGMGLLCGGLLRRKKISLYSAQILYGCAYASFTAALGVFVFLAAYGVANSGLQN
jgi:hypothetical protein